MNLGLPTVFAVITIIASSSVISAIVTAYFNRGNINANTTKTKADAAKIMSDMAVAQTMRMSEQLTEFRIALQAHREWDKRMVVMARKAGIEMDDPPELWL